MDNLTLKNIPPQNIEAEQSILGSMLLDREAIPAATEIIKAEDFYREDHKEIFEAIIDLYEKAKPVDVVTVSERLKVRGTIDFVGGLTYIAQIAASVPTTSNVVHYSKIVEEKSILRKLIKASNDIAKMSYEAAEEVSLIMDSAEMQIFDILQKRNQKGVYAMKDVLVDTFNKLEELYNTKGRIVGVPSGFSDLDNKTSGFNPSDLVLIAARPSMGKTALALNIAQNAAVSHNIPTAIFSLEMSRVQLVNRFLSCEAMVDSQKIRTGMLEDEDWARIAKALGPLGEAPIYIDDTPGLSVAEVRAKSRRLKLEKNIGLIIIDYLQLMQGRDRVESRQQEISEISRSLKILAKEVNVPVIALSQLSRAPEMRAEHRPILSDLRDSGAIEQDADLVMFLYRDDYYNPDTEKKNVAEIIIAKHRNGSTGVVEVAWLGQYTKFANLERHRTDEFK